MAKDPRERFQSYDEFIMALTAARSQVLIRQLTGREPDPGVVATPGAAPASPTRSWWRR
jgi:hypothetical protein